MAPRRVARPQWFRAQGAVVGWAEVFRRHVQGVVLDQGTVGGIGTHGPLTHVPVGPRVPVLTHAGGLRGPVAAGPAAAATRSPAVDALATVASTVGHLKERAVDVQLRWQCRPEIGVPFAPFTVWTRRARTPLREVDVRTTQRTDGLLLRLPEVAADVLVDALVVDPAHAVGLLGTYRGGGLTETVDSVAVQPAPGLSRVTLRLRTSGVTRVLLVNGTDPKVQYAPLDETIHDDSWVPVELVGLPVPDPWPGTAYDTSRQGLTSALTDPVDAALQRLARGGPPIGYSPVTTSGHVVDPAWRAPDPTLLLKEIDATLLPHVERLFRPGLQPSDQALLLDSPPVDPPSANGQTSSLATKASLGPLSLLALPASADPFLALATGFGTAYPHLDQPQGEGLDFLVTADYPDSPLRTGPVQLAAFVPEPHDHVATTDPAHLTATRAGLVAPETRDAAWRESVTVQWDRVTTGAALGRPTGGLLTRVTGTGPAQVLAEERLAGDRRALVLVPDGEAPSAASGRTSMVDADQVIPLGSGGRHDGYPVAVQDVFGIWSRWRDARWDGTEPPPPGPRIVSLDLTSGYTGSTTCPATLTVELAVDWPDRTPTSVELHSVFFRTTSAADPVPPGVDPVLPAPPGAFRRDVSLPFAGDTLTAPAGVTVVHLDPTGENVVAPGSAQGEHGRRYKVTVPVPSLDFSVTPRWGVQVWLRTPLLVVADAGFLPDAAHPALAGAASPVPVPPILPPPPPGVPLGSTPDADNRSHARVAWSVPGGAALDPRKGVVVWECAETALRQAAGLPAAAAPSTLPGVRLAALWDAYDAMTPTQRRAAFRRVQELPGSARETDVALPPGTTDIHLFTVTTLSSTGVSSDWPAPATPHEALQAVAAPRLRRPGPPTVSSVVGAAGTVTVSLSAASDVPVAAFHLFRTRSSEAARRVETMGPAYAVVPATAGVATDPATGFTLSTGSWSGGFDASWDDWHVRAVAVPVATVPVEAVRGLPSLPSDIVTVRARPAGAPDLAPLVVADWGGAHVGLLVTTSTTAPARPLPDGVFRVSARVSAAAPGGGPVDVAPVALGEVEAGPIDASSGAPGGASSEVLLRTGPRAGGRVPLALWFTRPVATDAVDVVVRIADPLGRVTEQTVTVPPFAPDPPSLDLVDVVKIVGRGVLARVTSDAPIDAARPVTMTIVATRRRGGPVFPPAPLPRPSKLVVLLSDIPTVAHPSTDPIQVVNAGGRPVEYDVGLRVATPFTFRITLETADGATATLTHAVT